MAGMCLMCLSFLIPYTSSLACGDAVLKYEWQRLEFDWPSDFDKEEAIVNGTYVPERNLIAGIKEPEFADDNEEIDNGAHEKLLDSIFALDGKKRWKNEVRGLPSTSNNVDLTVHASTKKIQLEDLNVKSKHVQKQLKKPLSELETEKAQRQIARENMVAEMSKWEPVVQDIRAAPQTVYSTRPHGIKMYEAVQPKPFTPRTPLEKELFEALGKSEDILRPNQEMTVAETKAMKAMSVKEAKARRAELMKHNELLSRMELKAKWQNRIKSKRYRKIVRKDKVMAEKKLLEQLQKTDPEAFLDKLELMEKARMEERLTLKHRGGGKFSRTHKAYSKFDDKTREAVQEMLQKSREITQKRQAVSSSEDESNEDMDTNEAEGNAENDSDDDVNVGTKEAVVTQARQHEVLKAVNKKAGGWLDVPKTNFVYTHQESEAGVTAELNRSNIDDITFGVSNESTSMTDINSDASTLECVVATPVKKSGSESTKTVKNTAHNPTELKIVPSHLHTDHRHSEGSDIEDSERASTIKQSSQKQNTPQQQQNVTSEPKKKKKKRNKKKKNDESVNKTTAAGQKEKPVKEINLETVSDKEDEDSDEDGMKVTMEELFQDEDVIEEFAKEKAEAEERSRPKFEDTKLPGWGIWAGPDYIENKQNVRQKKRAIDKARRLQLQQQRIKQPNVWINPNKDEAIRKLQPKTVPFPFTSVQQYEASLRQPISRGFVRETAFKLLTKPEVVTKLGHIIKPLDKDEYFKSKRIADSDIEDRTNKSGARQNKGGKRRRSVR